MENTESIRCCICGQPIIGKCPWNPEIKEQEPAKFHKFDPSKNLFCKHCYEKFKTMFNDGNNENA